MSPCHLVILATLLLTTLVRADDYDRWYTVEMMGGRAGWCHAQQKTVGDRVTTRTEMTFEIGRAAQAVKIGMIGEFVETKGHKPISLSSEMRLGMTPSSIVCTYGENEIKIRSKGADGEKDVVKPLPSGTWLTPAAATEFVKQRLGAKADRIEVRSVDPTGGMDPMSALEPVITTHRDCKPTTLEAMGKVIPVTRCLTTVSTQKGVESVEYLDEQGIPVRSETTMGGIAVVMSAATREEARAKRAGPEMMTTTFITPDRPIENARSTRRAAYHVSTPEGKLPVFPTTGAQRFTPDGEREARVEIEMAHPAPAPAADASDESFSKSSATVTSDDEEVRKLAARAVEGAGSSNTARAEALRKFVHEYITEKDLGVGFASASETARSRRGDCTEHGVLLAAMLRAQGIPSRLACGLVYADGFAGSRNIFGYHMWSQALLDVEGKPTWVDLDATLSAEQPFDATHIALAVSALADGQTQDALLAIATIIGRLQIKVERAE